MERGEAGTILIVDDNAQNLLLLQAQLERTGYAVRTAPSGRAGLESIAAEPPDLILLDIMMPGMDGYEVCRQLKQRESTRAIPVLMLTALQDRSDKIRGLEAGADDFLTKPVDRAELLARVRSLLRMKRLYDELTLSRDDIAQQAHLIAVEKSRAEAVVYSISDGVITTDVQGLVMLINPAAEAITGFSLEEAVGKDWRDALGVRDQRGHTIDDATCPVRRVLRTDAPISPTELSVWRRDDQDVAISLSAAPIRKAGGETVGVVAVFRDVTREREVERMKQEFVALVSHELRTPLAAIFGFAELMIEREELTERGRLYCETIYKESRRLTHLVSDFLDLERHEAGRISYHLRSLSVREALDEVSQRVSGQLANRTLVVDLPEGDVAVYADADRLAQVLTNLIGNATKYSPDGGEIRVSAQAHHGEAVISVHDQGLGIPSEAMPNLFSKFFRVDRPEHRKQPGSGLGLAICKQIVEGWHGRIWAESKGPGEGSTFSFTARLSPVEPKPLYPDLPQPSHGRVLIVKDHPSLSTMMTEQLRSAGYEVEVVRSGEEALAVVQENPPAVVVLDIGLAGQLDGWDVLRALRSGDYAHPHLPVIMVSGQAPDEEYRALGVDEYLMKPVPAETLIRSVGRVALPDRDRPILIADDDETTRRYLREALNGAGFEVVEAADGEEALAKARATHPRALLLDLMMPRVTGFEVLDAIRSDDSLKTTPVIVLTAMELTDDDRRDLLQGVDGLLQKDSTAASRVAEAVLETLGHT